MAYGKCSYTSDDECVISRWLKLLFSHVVGCIVESSSSWCGTWQGWLGSLSHVGLFYLLFSLSSPWNCKLVLFIFILFLLQSLFYNFFLCLRLRYWSWLCPVGVHMNNQSHVKIKDLLVLKLINVKWVKYMWNKSVWNMRVRVC